MPLTTEHVPRVPVGGAVTPEQSENGSWTQTPSMAMSDMAPDPVTAWMRTMLAVVGCIGMIARRQASSYDVCC